MVIREVARVFSRRVQAAVKHTNAVVVPHVKFSVEGRGQELGSVKGGAAHISSPKGPRR